MPITLLLDLDDTLLDINMDTYIPAYFKALASALADKVSPEQMLPALTGGTRAMMANLDPALSLREVFDAHFFPRLGIERQALQADIDLFYDVDFPKLGHLTKPIPQAVTQVDWAFQQGFRVVIATNPLFPLKAVQHRLRWAGLPPEKYPFSLVSSYETFHFTKENVAYYPEVMAQLGWPDDPLIMVGDDLEREEKPTRAAGFPFYMVRHNGEPLPGLGDIPQGRLEDFRTWFERTDSASLKVDLQSSQAKIAMLRSTPAGFLSLTRDLPSTKWQTRPATSEWCLNEIACHLRDVEREVYLPRVRKILAEDNPFLPGIETNGWVEQRGCAQQDGRQVLVDFIAARQETINLLKDLGQEWGRSSRHAIFGPTTLQELVGFICDHDRAHLQQIWKTIHPANNPIS